MNKSIITEVISFVTIILFLYTGINKMADHSQVAEQLALSPLLKPFAGLIAWLLPIAEFTTAVLLFVPNCRLYGFYGAAGLMVAFTLYVVGILIFADHLPCSCGGIIEKLSWKQHLIVNCLLIFLEFIGIRFQKDLKTRMKLSSQLS